MYSLRRADAGAPSLCWGRPESRFRTRETLLPQRVERQKAASYLIGSNTSGKSSTNHHRR